MGILKSALKIFTWWDGSTLNFRLWSWRKGVKVGEDAQGNQYYHTRDDSRRWVMFNGEDEASKIDVQWHGWLHRTYKEPPTEKPLPRQKWERAHQKNLTGSALAYAPPGSIRRAEPKTRRDYEAWKPE